MRLEATDITSDEEEKSKKIAQFAEGYPQLLDPANFQKDFPDRTTSDKWFLVERFRAGFPELDSMSLGFLRRWDSQAWVEKVVKTFGASLAFYRRGKYFFKGRRPKRNPLIFRLLRLNHEPESLP